MRSLHALSLSIAVAAALQAGACGPGEPDRPPNVVLLVLDTVRADHLGCYGYALPTTPRIDALAQVADRYARVEATAPWTLPSHASMFTGRLSFQHGAHAGRGSDGKVFDARPLAPQHVTLAEALAAAGYRTAGFVANTVYLSGTFGMQQGFERYEIERVRAPETTDKLLRWLDEDEGSQPFFAFVNLMDAHRPYNVDPLPDGRSAALPTPAPDDSALLLNELVQQVIHRGERPDPELVRKAVTQYDHGVAWGDWAVGRVVDALEERGLYDDTLLIVTSDHGEFLGEHDLIEHSKDVYQPVIAVPLVVKRPRQTAGRVLEERASLADLPGLVAAHLPRELRERHASHFPPPGRERPILAELYYTRYKDIIGPGGERFLRERHALYADRYKYILSSDGNHELYDLEADPDEAHNLVEERATLAGALQTRLRALLATGPGTGAPPEVPQLTPEQLEELRQLGYL